MSGKQGMRSNKRTTLPKRLRPGWLKKGDGRTTLYRALHQRLLDLGQQFGGLDAISPIERSLLERLVHIEARVIAVEDKLRAGKPTDDGSYLALVDRLHGLSKTLGLQYRIKKAPDLHAYMAAQGSDGSKKP